MDDIFAIISGGEYASMPDIEKAKVVVACDKGYEYALAAGINPGVIVGDFDSYSGKLPSGVETIRLKADIAPSISSATFRRLRLPQNKACALPYSEKTRFTGFCRTGSTF